MGDLFGDKLKKIRLEKELSQQQLADFLGTSKQVISRYETNQRTPKITIAQEYADKLNVPLNYLIDENISSPAAPTLPDLTPKDERQIAKDLENMINSLGGAAAMGSPEDAEDMEMLKASLETAMRLSKRIAKKKYTPKKYRNE